MSKIVKINRDRLIIHVPQKSGRNQILLKTTRTATFCFKTGPATLCFGTRYVFGVLVTSFLSRASFFDTILNLEIAFKLRHIIGGVG